ncbi:STAS domain-containing protein [Streptomyces sp. NPDC046557]|uniref:STAS domain-containing protein n=1 Tax=Streptomyces sp. NPDC046557 TaxID=3155372 RepID=UPI0034093C76
MDSFEITVERTAQGSVRIRPAGEIDQTSRVDLEAVLASLPAGAPVVLDMSGVPFMDLVGLRFLLGLRRLTRASGASVRIEGWQDQPRRLLDVAARLGALRTGSQRSPGVSEVREDTRDRAELERFLGSAQAQAEVEAASRADADGDTASGTAAASGVGADHGGETL